MEYDFEDPNFDFAGNAEIISAKLRKAREMQNTEAPKGIQAGNMFVMSRPDIGGAIQRGLGRYEQAQAEQARGSMNTEQLRRYDELSRGLNEMKPIDYSNPDEAVVENSRRMALAGQMAKLNLPQAQKAAEIYLNKGAAFPETMAKARMEQIERGEIAAKKLEEVEAQKKRDDETRRWQMQQQDDTRRYLGGLTASIANTNAEATRNAKEAKMAAAQAKIDAAKEADQKAADRFTMLTDGFEKEVKALDDSSGITSTSNRAGTNLGAWAANTGLGQTVGKMFGTKNQSSRNKIALYAGNMLLELKALKDLPASMMNSNMELKRNLENISAGENVDAQTMYESARLLRDLVSANKTEVDKKIGGTSPAPSGDGAAPATRTYRGVTYDQKPGTTGKNKSDWVPR